MSSTTKHITLLGDSIFDNAVYVRGKKSVINHLTEKIKPHSWKATLVAVDGNVVKDIAKYQLSKIPKDTTHLFISVGGNDGLGSFHITTQPSRSVGESAMVIAQSQSEFRKKYDEMMDAVMKLALPTTLCTIYNPNFGPGDQQIIAEYGLAAFNDVIIQAAIKHGLPIIDLKSLFNDKNDYANPIEPSEQGGDKITDVIMKMMNNYDFESKSTQIFSGK